MEEILKTILKTIKEESKLIKDEIIQERKQHQEESKLIKDEIIQERKQNKKHRRKWFKEFKKKSKEMERNFFRSLEQVLNDQDHRNALRLRAIRDVKRYGLIT